MSKLSTFRFNQTVKALAMVEAGRSEMDLRHFFGGIGANELRINFPQVWHALQEREAAFAADKASLLQTMEEARVLLRDKKI